MKALDFFYHFSEYAQYWWYVASGVLTVLAIALVGGNAIYEKLTGRKK